jgi:hypothetical protein
MLEQHEKAMVICFENNQELSKALMEALARFTRIPAHASHTVAR